MSVEERLLALEAKVAELEKRVVALENDTTGSFWPAAKTDGVEETAI